MKTAKSWIGLLGISFSFFFILGATALSPGGEEGSGEATGKAAKAKDSKKTAKAASDKKQAKKAEEAKEEEKKKEESGEEGGGESEEKAKAKDEEGKAGEGKKAKDEWEPDDPDARFIKDNLKGFVHGTVSFAKDGTVTIDYDFSKKVEEFEKDFIPPISSKVGSPFRWSVRHEEYYATGYYGLGIRISDQGSALLNVWFEDDVEASMDYYNGINWSKTQTCAIVFQTKGGKGIGNNFGAQCANFSGGRYQGGVPQATEPVAFEESAKIGFRMKGGNFEALRAGKLRKTVKYSEKTFASGRIGFAWGGKLAGTIRSVRVQGKLDIPAMVKELRKASAR